ncbi:hypothetical protein E2C01_083737 [Portunus trituberculatus]|uniref:Uncharacterized protein n=1 Tax=Portunus trituberculatus TaxID=210409 RepID=A0A5B7J227_PORTR|nr:hypothetical protein [Portunus trituberculatus]
MQQPFPKFFQGFLVSCGLPRQTQAGQGVLVGPVERPKDDPERPLLNPLQLLPLCEVQGGGPRWVGVHELREYKGPQKTTPIYLKLRTEIKMALKNTTPVFSTAITTFSQIKDKVYYRLTHKEEV